jgi:hypothetical protein
VISVILKPISPGKTWLMRPAPGCTSSSEALPLSSSVQMCPDVSRMLQDQRQTQLHKKQCGFGSCLWGGWNMSCRIFVVAASFAHLVATVLAQTSTESTVVPAVHLWILRVPDYTLGHWHLLARLFFLSHHISVSELPRLMYMLRAQFGKICFHRHVVRIQRR